ncbi:Fe-S cluster assembly ATPase SufC [bacterium]|nr:Fe-S cluster assembly ATPase SufC [bacterium]
MFSIQNFSVFVATQNIIKDFSCTFKQGATVVVMGPNGSGKSSLVSALAGHPAYQTTGEIVLNNGALHDLSPDKRAQQGLFLSMQYPQEIPGVPLNVLLKESWRALYPTASFDELNTRIKFACELLKLDPVFLERNVNEGLSGGEKKRSEILQLLVLQPKVALLDEIDSGLDVDSLKLVNNALKIFKVICPDSLLIIITHYQHILDGIHVDQVLVMKDGLLVADGDVSLINTIQQHGYDQF